MPETFSLTERAVMLTLLAEARPLSNADLRALGLAALEGGARRRLNDAKLVESVRHGRSFVHELTDDGWAWCGAELTAAVPRATGSAAGALYAVLRATGRYLTRADVPLSQFCGPDAEHLVLQAYERSAPAPGGWVPLADVRDRLDGLPRGTVDDALRGLIGRPGISLVPGSNQKVLTERDRAAAVRIGGEDIHAMAVRDHRGAGRSA